MKATNKPIPLRIVFILNAIMMILPFVFYFVITSKDIEIGGIEPMWMVYTGLTYIISFALLVMMILKKNLIGIRIMILLNAIIALPVKAYLGILVAIISLILTFNGKVKNYFSA